ncbi:MAG TPA: DUF4276 family protein [Desulfuromonadaceae bacterium]
MHIEFLVEEQSAESALVNLIPKIIGHEVSFKIHPFQGKPNLLANLPARLKGYRQWLPEDWRIVVLMDVDNADCRVLKQNLDQMASDAGLTTKTASGGEKFQVLNRLAVEELEAWFIGDEEAISSAYPRIKRNIAQQEKYRDPDAIAGGTWEALERLLQKAGYFRGGLGKVAAAREISQYMAPERNRSRSFQAFRDGLLALVTSS